MTRSTKIKNVRHEVLYEYVLPAEDEKVVKLKSRLGNNLHEVETADGDLFLVSMPTKFKKVIWIKRGDYLIVKPIEEGHKVKAEITRILYKDQIEYIKEYGRWPPAFESKETTNQECLDEDGLFINTNRQILESEEEKESESSEEDIL